MTSPLRTMRLDKVDRWNVHNRDSELSLSVAIAVVTFIMLSIGGRLTTAIRTRSLGCMKLVVFMRLRFW